MQAILNGFDFQIMYSRAKVNVRNGYKPHLALVHCKNHFFFKCFKLNEDFSLGGAVASSFFSGTVHETRSFMILVIGLEKYLHLMSSF